MMRFSFKLFFFTAISTLVFSSCSDETQAGVTIADEATIAGDFALNDSTSPSDVEVRIYAERALKDTTEGSLVYSGNLDSSGKFTSPKLPEGDYSLFAKKKDYNLAKASSEIVLDEALIYERIELEEGEDISLNLELLPLQRILIPLNELENTPEEMLEPISPNVSVYVLENNLVIEKTSSDSLIEIKLDPATSGNDSILTISEADLEVQESAGTCTSPKPIEDVDSECALNGTFSIENEPCPATWFLVRQGFETTPDAHKDTATLAFDGDNWFFDIVQFNTEGEVTSVEQSCTLDGAPIQMKGTTVFGELFYLTPVDSDSSLIFQQESDEYWAVVKKFKYYGIGYTKRIQ